MKETSRRGFTLIEIVITIAIFSVFVAFTIPPLVAAIRVAGHETSLLRMDQDAHRAMNGITTHLRGAILPIITDPDTPPEYTSQATLDRYHSSAYANDSVPFQNMINSSQGFRQFGPAWRRLLLLDNNPPRYGGSAVAGSDFIPFTIPVPYIYPATGLSSVDSLDSNSLPQLGIRGLDGTVYNAAVYNEVNDVFEGKPTIRRYLPNADGALHPFISGLNPTALGLTPGVRQDIAIGANRFGTQLNLPAGANYALGAIRFVPYLEGGQPYIVTERQDYDLNDDNDTVDQYALGRIEVVYCIGSANNPREVRRPISANSVLLQLNAATQANYQPLFQLRVQPRDDPTNPPKVSRQTSLVLDINLLMCDELNQRRNPDFTKAVKYLTRRYRTSVELRNMSLE